LAIAYGLKDQVDAICTAPISKEGLRAAGYPYPGHTELLAHLMGARRFAMMLYSPTARAAGGGSQSPTTPFAVAFATLHCSLASVPGALRTERIVEVGELLAQYLRALGGGVRPRLAVLGLNPHAGEQGIFGDEEARIVAPAVRRLRRRGLLVEGPLPPDTAFTPRALARYQGHVCLYHDQGCIPFKMVAFDSGVNVTMGLGLVRTSPDHGTAFDIAWRGLCRPRSFYSAYALAARLAEVLGGESTQRGPGRPARSPGSG
jgi:4-hydroxythreonine-4-phosphate dehydrogenase